MQKLRKLTKWPETLRYNGISMQDYKPSDSGTVISDDVNEMEGFIMIKWGVIGTGLVVDMFCSDFPDVEGAKLHSIYGRRHEKANEVASKFGFSHVFSDLDEFLSQSDLDVVYIGTPHTTHADFAIRAMKAGKHVLCEKPFAVNEEEVKTILKTSKETGRFVMEALWTLYLPSIIKALEWIEAGDIGDVRLITADFGDALSTDPKSRIHNPDLAGGALLDVGIYPVLLSNAVNKAMPDCIKAHTIFTKTGVDDTTTMSMNYGDDTTASLSASVSVRTKWSAVIYGTKGHIEIPEFYRAKEAILVADECEEFYMDRSAGLGYQHEAQAVTDLIASGATESPIVTHEFSLNLIRTLDRIRKEIGLIYPFE